MTTRINIATAGVLISLAISVVIAAPTASAARGAKSTVKHHSQPKIHLKVPGATARVGIPGGCISAFVEEYYTTFTCDGGVPMSSTSNAVPAAPIEAVQPFSSSLELAVMAVPGDGSAPALSVTSDSTSNDAADNC